MRKSVNKKTGIVRHAMCAVLALALTAALLVTGVMGMISMLLHNRAMHEAVALDDRVIDAQMQRIAQGVTALSETYPFDAEAILEMIDRESVMALNRETVAWWMDVAQGVDTAERPVWQGGDIENAIREDARFLENVPTGLQKATARDKITPGIHAVISQTVLPVRSVLVDFAVAEVLARVPVLRIAQLVRMAPWALLCVCLVLEGLILLLCRRDRRSRALWGASPLAACGLVVIAVWLLLMHLDLPQRVGVMSPFAAIQVELMMRQATLCMAATAAGCILCAAVWMALANRRTSLAARRKETV